MLAVLVLASCAQVPGNRIDLGSLSTGATVSFFRSGTDQWGLEIAGEGAVTFAQTRPVQIEL